jgi:hypothetical protein
MTLRDARLSLALGTIALGLTVAPSRAEAPAPSAVDVALARMDVGAADRALALAATAGQQVALPLARVAVHRGDARLALKLLEAVRDPRSGEARELRGVALGLVRATLGAQELRTQDGALRVHLQHRSDEALLPLLHETVLAARRVTEETLGYAWTAPTYVVLVRDQQTLAEATGLPYESASTTGTLAIAKWGRVTMLSPRATESPIPWRDTVVHELAHLALTAVTNDRAPLWLQEGVAKDMEIRWRELDMYDERPDLESVVRAAIAKGEYLPLDKLGPSVAMLPSAHAAEIAFAAATAFVRHLRQELGAEGFHAYLRALAEGGVQDALSKVTGRGFSEWHGAWLASVERRASVSGAANEPSVDRAEVAKRSRLARLLVQRGHGDAALAELARAPKATWVAAEREGGWRTIHALAHDRRRDDDALDRLLFAEAPSTEPLAPWYRLRARRGEARGDVTGAARDRGRAVAREPYGPEAVCEAGRTGPEAALCEAARARTAPSLD